MHTSHAFPLLGSMVGGELRWQKNLISYHGIQKTFKYNFIFTFTFILTFTFIPSCSSIITFLISISCSNSPHHHPPPPPKTLGGHLPFLFFTGTRGDCCGLLKELTLWLTGRLIRYPKDIIKAKLNQQRRNAGRHTVTH